MSLTTHYSPGVFNWVDLATHDAEGAVTFYADLLGWTAQNIAIGAGVFTMLYDSDKAVASLYQLSKLKRIQGVPAHWMTYVAVANVDQTVQRVQQLGGQVLVPSFAVLDWGCMALLLDPTGVPFAVWQTNSQATEAVVSPPDTLAWHELITPAPMRAAAFYAQLFGWQVNAVGGDSWIFCGNGRWQAGMERALTNKGPSLSHWRTYFAVPDCENSLAQAQALGGRLVTPTNNGLFGRSALIQDPQGAICGLMQLNTLPQNMLIHRLTNKRQKLEN